MGFLDGLRAALAGRAARPAVEWRGRAYAYGELERLAGSAAALLQARGMGPGERVAVRTADRFAFLVAHQGGCCWAAGSACRSTRGPPGRRCATS